MNRSAKVESFKKLYKLIQDASIRGIISDLDGTLIHSAPLHKKAYQAAFQKCGQVFYDDIWERESIYGGAAWLERMLVRGGISDVGDAAKKIKTLKYEWFANHANELEIMTETKEFLYALHQAGRFRIACVTAAGLVGAKNMLQHTGMNEIFEYLLTSDDMPKGITKFDPFAYEHVATRFNLSPSDCLVLDDNELCLKTAQKAGMATYHMPTRTLHYAFVEQQ